MASQFLIPHPNIPTADIGLPKLKEVTVKNNENFLALDKLLQELSTSLTALDKAKAEAEHTHEFAPLEHSHEMAEIEGLISALEQKAPLVHTHDQYLTEIPTHSHTEDQVDGLLAHLAEKANIEHKHNLGDIDALQESLNAKASNQRVDWIENNTIRKGTQLTPNFLSGAEAASHDDDNFDTVMAKSKAEQYQTSWQRGVAPPGSSRPVGFKIMISNGTMKLDGGEVFDIYGILSFDENGCAAKMETAKHWTYRNTI